VWRVRFHPEAEEELGKLPAVEQAAILHAVEKLEALGPDLPFPHQSAVRGERGLRELRPRSGRSQWRALVARLSDVIVVLAIGPEAQVNRRRFDRTIAAAKRRLAELEE
jgi:hypothetical protein